MHEEYRIITHEMHESSFFRLLIIGFLWAPGAFLKHWDEGLCGFGFTGFWGLGLRGNAEPASEALSDNEEVSPFISFPRNKYGQGINR